MSAFWRNSLPPPASGNKFLEKPVSYRGKKT